MKKHLLSLTAATLFLTTPLFAETANPDKQPQRNYDAGGYIGATATPGNFDMAASLDAHVSPYLSFGPLLQTAFWNSRVFFTATAGGKFHFPMQQFLPGFELNYQSGIGYFYKRRNGFDFNNFIFVTGPGFDYFFRKPWAVTAMFLVNASNDRVDELFYSALAGVKYSF